MGNEVNDIFEGNDLLARHKNRIRSFALLQLKDDPATKKKRELAAGEASQMGYTISRQDYEVRYEQTVNEEIGRPSLLKKVRDELGREDSSDFNGRPVSVSDIILIKAGNHEEAYYVDPFGFRLLEDFS